MLALDSLAENLKSANNNKKTLKQLTIWRQSFLQKKLHTLGNNLLVEGHI